MVLRNTVVIDGDEVVPARAVACGVDDREPALTAGARDADHAAVFEPIVRVGTELFVARWYARGQRIELRAQQLAVVRAWCRASAAAGADRSLREDRIEVADVAALARGRIRR